MAANSQSAFNPQGNTVVVAADSTAPLGVQAPTTPGISINLAGNYRIINAGTQTVFLGIGASAEAAQAAAVAASAGSPAAGIPLVPGAVEIFSFDDRAWFSGYASSATTVYVTPGIGL